MTPTMPANLTPAEGVVVPRDLLPILEQIKMLSDPKHIEPSRQALDAIWGMAHTLETALAARPAAPTQSAAQTGEVETEATDLVARLNNAWVETVSPSPEGFRRSMVANVLNEARAAIQAQATLIEAQAAEIETLRRLLAEKG